MNNNNLLKLYNMPVFSNLHDFSELCHISSYKIFSIINNSYTFYRRYEIPKKSGNFRTIYQPRADVKAIQAWILRNILDKIQPSEHSTAFRKNYSVLDNAKPHSLNRYFLSLDIKDFFTSISIGQVANLFKTIGYNSEQAHILSRLCTCSNFLPQGGVTSPAISNLVVSKMDRRISGYCSKRNIIYTRYADDMTFSSNNRNILNSSKKYLIKIIENEKYEINTDKTRFSGPRIKTKVTGLIKNSSEPKFGIGKRNKNHMRSIIFNLLVNKRVINQKYSSIESVKGWLAFTKHVDIDSYNYLNKYFNRLLNDIGKENTI